MGHSIVQFIANETIMQEMLGSLSTLILLLSIAVCIALLSKGADMMIDGVVDLAQRTGIPRIVIGATIISLGTTMPEVFVSVLAAWMGNPDLALGNGVGSIIANMGLIFGLTCILASVPINRYFLKRSGLVQIGAATLLVVISVIAWLLTHGQPVLSRWVGFLLLGLLAVYLYISYAWAKNGNANGFFLEEAGDREPRSVWVCSVMIAGGLILVIAGARVLVPCASEIAARMGVPKDIIAATMVALGTSLPELMTAISAVRKGHPEITVGNVVGANILNCLFVTGAAACARPLAITDNFFEFHFPTMLILLYSFGIFIIINRDGRFKRWQGAILLSVYVIYVVTQSALKIGTVG